jgi:maltooligosyltrehalose trehalohydrolase
MELLHTAGSKTSSATTHPVGATPIESGGYRFVVWAPAQNTMSVRLLARSAAEKDIVVPFRKTADGYFEVEIEQATPGQRYVFRFEDGRERPDPASRFQPEGVHGPSELVSLNDFEWTDGEWKGLPFEKSVFYELHVGTYTAEGTFDALIPFLPGLRELGITTVELMPVAQCPGPRNWGYDGVQPFAAQNNYGGPRGLQKLVNAAHGCGLAVALDVVYNHLGPEGNYFGEYGPYFTEKYKTPWGSAINYDDADSDEVREFFIQNALSWLEHFHIDVLRLDAVHGIFDFGAKHFLAEMQQRVAELEQRVGRKLDLVAESDLNDSRLLRTPSEGGYGLSSQWADDFHHSLHSLLTGERDGYYSDFGGVPHLAKAMREGWVYTGQHSNFRRRKHGNSPAGLARSKFVVCIQNHDQIGNRARGERLSELVDFEALKLAAGVTVLSPMIPMLFMGEEYGEKQPFLYFVSHGDPGLIEAVRKGRQAEFAAFAWNGEVPDPQGDATFLRSKLKHELKQTEPHRTLLELYKHLLEIRAQFGLAQGTKAPHIEEYGSAILMLWGEANSPGGQMLAAIYEFGKPSRTIERIELPAGRWELLINSADEKWRGSAAGNAIPSEIQSDGMLRTLGLAGQSFAVFGRLNSPSEQ